MVKIGEEEITELHLSGKKGMSCQFNFLRVFNVHIDSNIFIMAWLLTQSLTDLCHQTDHALVYWESSMYVQVYTSFGLKMQVQMFPEIQLNITLPANHIGTISG